jgi:D-threonine aldolase
MEMATQKPGASTGGASTTGTSTGGASTTGASTGGASTGGGSSNAGGASTAGAAAISASAPGASLSGQPDSPWYLIDAVDQLDTPALVVYPVRVKENIDLALKMTGGPARLRPHVKTHKSPQATRLLQEAGVRQFKCATIAEAEMLAQCGAEDVLLAYQPIGPKARRLAALIQKYPATRFSCLIDDETAAASMAAIFSAAGLTVPVYLDLNAGMNRTGIHPGEAAFQLYKAASATEGIEPVGLHAYDGHIRDTDPELRIRKCDAAFAEILALQEALISSGFNKPILVVGGSPTFPIHSRRPQVQCSPGTFIYWDKGYSDLFHGEGFKPAALVVARVISLPDETTLCLDLGHKSIAAENELGRRVFFLNAPGLKAISQSEEHLVMEAGRGHSFKPGDILYGLPFHICPTIALYERAIAIENGRISVDWMNTARDRRIGV